MQQRLGFCFPFGVPATRIISPSTRPPKYTLAHDDLASSIIHHNSAHRRASLTKSLLLLRPVFLLRRGCRLRTISVMIVVDRASPVLVRNDPCHRAARVSWFATGAGGHDCRSKPATLVPNPHRCCVATHPSLTSPRVEKKARQPLMARSRRSMTPGSRTKCLIVELREGWDLATLRERKK